MPKKDPTSGECPECDQLVEALSEYLEGGLAEDLRHQIILHAQTCSQCSRLLFSLRRLVSYCKTEPSCEMPVEVREQLWVAIRQELYSPGDKGE